MKKFNLILFGLMAVFSFAMTACSNDNDVIAEEGTDTNKTYWVKVAPFSKGAISYGDVEGVGTYPHGTNVDLLTTSGYYIWTIKDSERHDPSKWVNWQKSTHQIGRIDANYWVQALPTSIKDPEAWIRLEENWIKMFEYWIKQDTSN
ncbi:hypothetical protein [Parabacteroides merdae]|uniref:hypothetical protein n=1 Tax=Parabacteroides merdae TaxID=46503 RepID=UPI0034A10792